MRYLAVFGFLVPILFWLVTFGARNLGGEVATLYTSDGTRTFQSNVWVIDHGTDVWLRANDPTSPWLDRIINQPDVQLRRGEIMRDYAATPLAHRRAEVNADMARNYTWAEWLLALVEDRDQVVAVYLDPFG